MFKKYLTCSFFLLFVSNCAYAQLESGGNPGAVIRNFSEQAKNLSIDKEFIETVPDDLDAERKRREEEEKLFKDVQKGGIIYNPKFRLKDLNFEGNTIFSDEKLKKLGKKSIIDQDIYLEDVLDYAIVVSRHYQRKGYLTTYAYIPQQDIKDGILTIVVSESKVEEKNVTGNFWARKFYIEKIATGGTHLSTGKVFNVKQLQGAVKKINRERYMSTEVAIEKNENEGTVLDFEMKDRFPLRFGLAWDDFGRDLLGRQRFTPTVGSDNLTGFGDRIYGSPILAQHSKVILAGYEIPISEYGTTVAYDFAYSKVDPAGEFASLGLVGKSTIHTVTVRQPFINTAVTDLIGYAAFDWLRSTTDLTTIAASIADYTLRVPKVGLNLMHDDNTGRWLANTEAAFGINGLGASGNVEGGPQSNFQRFTASVARVQRLPYDLLGIVRVNGQYSPQALFAAEQMFIGGPYSIWGFQPSETLGDWGVAGGAEIRFPIPFLKRMLPERVKHASDRIKLVTFYNWGLVRRYGEPNEDFQDFLQSVGFGTYISIAELLNIQIGVGFPVGAVPADSPSRARMYFTINTEMDRFMIPKAHRAKEAARNRTGTNNSNLNPKFIPVSNTLSPLLLHKEHKPFYKKTSESKQHADAQACEREIQKAELDKFSKEPIRSLE